MKFASFILAHNYPELLEDTIDAVKIFVSDDVIGVIDGYSWHKFSHLDLGCELVEGLRHGCGESPYRNILFGIQETYNRFNPDWIVFLESDVLFVSQTWRLEIEKTNKWFAGTNYRFDGKLNLPVLNEMIGGNIMENHYVLGCLMFFRRPFIEKLLEIIPKLIEETESFRGKFPDFGGFSFQECLCPSLANFYKPNSILILNRENDKLSLNRKFCCRWPNPIQMSDIGVHSTILHPSKNMDEVRKHFAKIRRKIKR